MDPWTVDCCAVPWWTVDLEGWRRSTGEWRPGQWLVVELRASSGAEQEKIAVAGGWTWLLIFQACCPPSWLKVISGLGFWD
uniref:Uncharacterized protein n=1 Tax=Fagus sylvatica TaxID=28930 RepID=A0A2N9GB11_FAGSY